MQQIKLADYQNSLRELGCSAELTDTVMQLLRSGDIKNAALLLRRHKHLLLAELHRTEQKVDLLDFLLYQLKNLQHSACRFCFAQAQPQLTPHRQARQLPQKGLIRT